MSKKQSSHTEITYQQKNNIKELPPTRDFGVLKGRRQKISQSQSIIYNSKNENSFSRMSNQQIISLIKKGNDKRQLRALSTWFAATNGIYSRAVRYLSDIYRFDFLLYPNFDLEDNLEQEKHQKILKNFNKILEHFDESSIQLLSRKWASKVCYEGCYYGYICDDINDKLAIQDLPIDYCRSRFFNRSRPIVEFNVQYFKKEFQSTADRDQVLKLFPEEIQEGYKKYLSGKLAPENQGDESGWIFLDLNRAFKFNFNDNDLPPFLYAIPSLLSLGEVQDLEKEKLVQQIQKLLIQEFQLDKNGQIPFTMPELEQLSSNAVQVVGDSIGLSVLSTIANVHLEDVSSDIAPQDSVKVAENTVYNDLGISTNLFNTDGNLALEKSIITDEAFVKPLILQFEHFLNFYIGWKFNKKDSKFRLKMLTTTNYNYQALSDKYKALTSLGFSRMLPMVSLGHSQKEIISTAKFESAILGLENYMLPPFTSNSISSKEWQSVKEAQEANIKKLEGNEGGRPSIPDDEKSEKTIANQEAMD